MDASPKKYLTRLQLTAVVAIGAIASLSMSWLILTTAQLAVERMKPHIVMSLSHPLR